MATVETPFWEPPVVWTRETLHQLVQERFSEYKLILVSNREPYVHSFAGKSIVCKHPAGGVVTGLEPIMRACGGVWVAHGSGNADRKVVDDRDHVRVPPDDPRYTLRRVWLTKAQENRYYYGLANDGLWPLCHVSYVRPVFRPEDWEAYREVNALFAEAVLAEAGEGPAFVFIQDYHFALLPRLLKNANPNLVVAQFWHIPWPNSEQFRTFPWKQELLDGMLGNDLLGFHLRYHCQNFLEAVDSAVECRVDRERGDVIRGGRKTLVRPFPISVDFERHGEVAASPRVAERRAEWAERLKLGDDRILGVGIERIDYTKGIPDRLKAIERFLETRPEHQGRLVFLQVGVPTRSHIPSYKRLDDEIDDLVEAINWKFATDDWTPIVYHKEHAGLEDMVALHQLARFCVVSSLHDGMNLVAKEFVASRLDEDGVLILSEFTGSSRELSDALLVNPYSVEEMAEAIRAAVEMPEVERTRRMRRMRGIVNRNNIYRWAGKILSTLADIDLPDDVDADEVPQRGAVAEVGL